MPINVSSARKSDQKKHKIEKLQWKNEKFQWLKVLKLTNADDILFAASDGTGMEKSAEKYMKTF